MNCNVSVQCAVYCTVHWLEAAGLVEDVLMGQRPHWHHCHWSPGHVTLTSPSSADCGLTPSWLCFRILLYQRPSPCHPHHGPATAQEGCLQQVHRESPQGEACHRENAIWKLKSLYNVVLWIRWEIQQLAHHLHVAFLFSVCLPFVLSKTLFICDVSFQRLKR